VPDFLFYMLIFFLSLRPTDSTFPDRGFEMDKTPWGDSPLFPAKNLRRKIPKRIRRHSYAPVAFHRVVAQLINSLGLRVP